MPVDLVRDFTVNVSTLNSPIREATKGINGRTHIVLWHPRLDSVNVFSVDVLTF
jgi:hypothetical protein